jgi:enterochelin esterase-like enzyme
MNFWQKPIETFNALMHRKSPHLRQIRHRYSPALAREVAIDVYLPPDYHLRPGQYYPWLLLNDGQDLPVMHFSRILEGLYFRREIPQIIAIGVHAGHDRIREYGVLRQADYKGRGDRARQYQQFLLEELLPDLRRRFRLSQDREDAMIAGFSLGGLSAFDLGWAYPQLFGKVGVFSGALWWRWEPVYDHNADDCRIMHDVVEKTSSTPEDQYYWFQTGTLDEEDDRNNNGVIDSIDDTLDLIRELKRKDIHDAFIRYYEVEGGRHEPATWGAAMPDFLKWSLSASYSEYG